MGKYTPVFAADIMPDLSIKFHQQDVWDSKLASLKGKRVKITMREFKASDNIRSIRANAYYWGVVIEILRDYFGYEKEEMHDALGLLFRRNYDGPIETVDGTSGMKSEAFWNYIERVRIWAATNWQLNIPDPNMVE